MAKAGGPRVRIVTPEKALGGTYVDGGFPLRLVLHDLAPAADLHLGPAGTDCLGYVWQGAVTAAAERLEAGSSFVVEHGRSLSLRASAGGARVLVFAAADPAGQDKPGGRVHLLPNGRVPRSDALGSGGVAGGMHADSECPTCSLWLHENRFPPMPEPTPDIAARSIHSHSEPEIIFVTEGHIRLGRRLFGAGTAVAIAADTLYAISAGPEGMAFVNFRPGRPSDFRFANGATMSETGYWRERVARPDYVVV